MTISRFFRRERPSANNMQPDRLEIAILLLGLVLFGLAAFGGLAAFLAVFSQVR